MYTALVYCLDKTKIKQANVDFYFINYISK